MKLFSLIALTAVLFAALPGTAISQSKLTIPAFSRQTIFKPKPKPLVIDFTSNDITLTAEERLLLLSLPAVRAAVEEEAKKISDAELQALDQCLDRVSQTGECANAQDYLECAVEVCSRT